MSRLRQPLEEGSITILRARAIATYPCSFMLVASMNPTRGGSFLEEASDLSSVRSAKRYMSKISGPLLDRIDLQMEVQPVPFEKLSSDQAAEPSHKIRERVSRTRRIQQDRYKNQESLHCNGQMGAKETRRYCRIQSASLTMLQKAMKSLQLSARAYDRILRVSRTIADLSECDEIKTEHIAEAIHYRSLDRLRV